MSSDGPGIGAIAIVVDQGRVLVVQRGKAPDAGCWAFPGGSIERGEPARDAALRELQEETGLTARPVRWLDPYDAIDPEGRHHFVLVALLCDQPRGQLCAADDAQAARWVTLKELEQLETSGGVVDYARELL